MYVVIDTRLIYGKAFKPGLHRRHDRTKYIDQIFYRKRSDYIRSQISKYVDCSRKQHNETDMTLIVDFGCGTGAAVRNVAEFHSHYHYCSPNLRFIGVDKKITPEDGDGYNLYQDDLTILSQLEPDSVDFGYSCAVLDYIDDKVLALKNIWLKLKMGGEAIVSITPDHFGPYALELFPVGDDISWDKDYQALRIKKTQQCLEELASSCFVYVPIGEVLPKHKLQGSESVPDFIKLQPCYLSSIACSTPRLRYKHASQSLYVRQEDLEGRDLGEVENIEYFVTNFLYNADKYPDNLKLSSTAENSLVSKTNSNGSCCIL